MLKTEVSSINLENSAQYEEQSNRNYGAILKQPIIEMLLFQGFLLLILFNIN